jgi:hypothetical protein
VSETTKNFGVNLGQRTKVLSGYGSKCPTCGEGATSVCRCSHGDTRVAEIIIIGTNVRFTVLSQSARNTAVKAIALAKGTRNGKHT